MEDIEGTDSVVRFVGLAMRSAIRPKSLAASLEKSTHPSISADRVLEPDYFN